jgi:ectoine hydroxylase-related dioxygenase (phytanoyl-CoA dioxygenase family)
MTAAACSKLFDHDGFVELPELISGFDCSQIARDLSETRQGRAGIRNLLDQKWCQSLAQHLKCNKHLSGLLSDDYVAVQCTLFDKTPDHPWKVPFHQDLSIPVRKRVDTTGFLSWSQKEGAWYTQPPTSVLEKIVAVRLHIDDCGVANGPLRVIKRSHHMGRITENDISAVITRGCEVVCTAKAGDVIVMRPLLLHASSKPTNPSTRRVLHFLFGPTALPQGLEWHRMI